MNWKSKVHPWLRCPEEREAGVKLASYIPPSMQQPENETLWEGAGGNGYWKLDKKGFKLGCKPTLDGVTQAWVTRQPGLSVHPAVTVGGVINDS